MKTQTTPKGTRKGFRKDNVTPRKRYTRKAKPIEVQPITVPIDTDSKPINLKALLIALTFAVICTVLLFIAGQLNFLLL